MPYAYNHGVRIYWEEEGQGEPLLMIMGLSFPIPMWGPLRQAMARHYRLILFDSRAAGQSDVPLRPFRIASMARDAECVLDAASVQAAHVCGFSMGGMIAQEFTLCRPERVVKLVLGATHCGGFKAVLADPEVLRLLASPFLTMEARLLAILPYLYDPHTPQARINQDIRTLRENAPTALGFFQQLTAIASWHSYRRLPQIKIPTLVLHGATDRLIPPENARILAERIPHARLVILPDAGHVFPSDQPERTIATLCDFLMPAANP